MARVLKLTVLVLSTCMMMIVGVLATLRAGEPSEAIRLLHPGDCAQPCWHGIQPGKTTLDEAAAILRADGTYTLKIGNFTGSTRYQLCWNRIVNPRWDGCATRGHSADPNAPIEQLDLIYPELLLGEAVQVLGEPIGIQLSSTVDTLDGYVYFKGNIEVTIGSVYVAIRDHMQTFVPHMRVVRLSYSRLDRRPCKLHPWTGFSTRTRDLWACNAS